MGKPRNTTIAPLRRILEPRWRDLLPLSAAGSKSAAAAFDELITAYSAPGRHYHGLTHIAALLELAEGQRAHFQDRTSVELAVFYHDAVYDIARKDNEAQSARLAETRLAALDYAPEKIARVATLIEATAHGVAVTDPGDGDMARFIDLDLSILAAPRPGYAQYMADIRREYAVYPDIVYRTGRRRVLQSFLDRERIYQCADLHALWDRPARDNLSWEFGELGRDAT